MNVYYKTNNILLIFNNNGFGWYSFVFDECFKTIYYEGVSDGHALEILTHNHIM